MVKKETGGLRAHGNKAKIKKLHNDRNNTGVEYKNIVLQNSTYKQTTYNYYTNDVKRPVKMKTNQTLSSERRKNPTYTERANKSVGTRSGNNKKKYKTTVRY